MGVPPRKLDEAMARTLLARHGLVAEAGSVHLKPLGGGVSSVVLLAEAPEGRFVLKQPQERFDVKDEWIVDVRRVAAEVEFVRLLGPQLPAGSFMPVRAFAEDDLVAVFDAAPASWTSWKHRLLAGKVEAGLASAAGDWIARVHNLGDQGDLRGRLDHPDLFDQQRLDPYYRTTAARVAEAREALEALIADFGGHQDLVHGDFSPKNILTDGKSIAVIDHEVVTRGDAAFDVAFLLNHLLLKAVHLPAHRQGLVDAARAARDAYEGRRVGRDDGFWPRTMAHLAGLQLSRARGKSPAEYLTSEERTLVTRFGLDLVRRPAKDLDDAVERLPQTLTRRDL